MTTWLIIDGYNLVHHLPRLQADLPPDLAGRREFLLRLLEGLAGVLAERVTVVFDGAQPGGAAAPKPAGGVEVMFSRPGQSADAVIEALVSAAAQPGDITVVTSDRPERDGVAACGADAISSALFLDRLAAARERLDDALARRSARGRAFTFGDLFPGAT